MSDQTTAPPLPDLPWTGTRELGVVSASGYSIAHVDPMFRFPAEDVHRISKFLAAAPETAEKLRELAAVAEELLAVVMIQNGNLHADINDMTARARAVLARARGA